MKWVISLIGVGYLSVSLVLSQTRWTCGFGGLFGIGLLLWRTIPFGQFGGKAATEFLEALCLLSKIWLQRFKIAIWVLTIKEFNNFKLNEIILNWEACITCGVSKWRKLISWTLPPSGFLKFNINGVVRGKQGPVSVERALCSCNGEVMFMFSRRGD